MGCPEISREIKTLLTFMLRDEESENYGYTAKMTKEWHEKHGIWVINLPPCSPNLNSNEHVWSILKHKLFRIYPNLHELKNNTADMEIFLSRIKEAWKCIDQAHIRRLVASIPVRLDACRDTRGWYTTY